MNKIKLNFDVSRGGIQHRIFVRAGDKDSRTVIAKFYSGNEQINFKEASVRILSAYGSEFLSPCIVEGGAAIYTFTTDELICGEAMCEFILRDGEMLLTSPKFSMVCEDVLFGGEGAEGSSEYTAYLAALAKLENLSVSAESGEEASAAVNVGESDVHIAFTIPKGEKGAPGSNGKDGADGKDYVITAADKEEIKSYIDGYFGEVGDAINEITALQQQFIGGSV